MDDIIYNSPKAQVDAYMKSTLSEEIKVRSSKIMKMDINYALRGNQTATEFVRLAIAEKLAAVTMADQITDAIGDINNGLIYTRNKIETTVDETTINIEKMLVEFILLLEERDKSYIEAIELRDKEFLLMSENLIRIAQSFSDSSLI